MIEKIFNFYSRKHFSVSQKFTLKITLLTFMFNTSLDTNGHQVLPFFLGKTAFLVAENNLLHRRTSFHFTTFTKNVY